MNELIMKSSHNNLKPLSQPEKFRTPVKTQTLDLGKFIPGHVDFEVSRLTVPV